HVYAERIFFVEILAPILVFLLIIAMISLGVWACAEIIHKAGFSRWYVLLMFVTGGIGMLIFALIEWPVHRELAWLRVKSGEGKDADLTAVETYAVELEKRGEWKKAAEVFEALAQRAPSDEGSVYYRNCIQRLRERMVEGYSS